MCTMFDMSTHSLRELRTNLGAIVRKVAYTGEETIITDSGTEIAVIISMADYERLHEHADVADALRIRQLRQSGFSPMSMTEMLDALADVSAEPNAS
jgi:antitoxin YefM